MILNKKALVSAAILVSALSLSGCDWNITSKDSEYVISKNENIRNNTQKEITNITNPEKQQKVSKFIEQVRNINKARGFTIYEPTTLTVETAAACAGKLSYTVGIDKGFTEVTCSFDM